MVPSREPPISTSWSWARPWPRATMLSERVSVHLSGRPTRRASQAINSSSG